MRRAFTGFLLAMAVLSLVWVQVQVDARRNAMPLQEEMLYLSSGGWVKRLSLGYDGLLAGLYWTRAVQHYGSEKLGLQRYNLLYELVDITTTLDPDLTLAYRFGATFLSSEPPSGPGRSDQAIQLLEKGLAHEERWELYFDLGFLYYLRLEDYERSADAFERGAKFPRAPLSVGLLATRVRAKGKNRQTAMLLWEQLYNSTDDPSVRAAALAHLMGLRADADAEALEALVARYSEETGRLPEGWQDLVRVGFLQGIPADPMGAPYVLGADGGVRLHPKSQITTSELEMAQ